MCISKKAKSWQRGIEHYQEYLKRKEKDNYVRMEKAWQSLLTSLEASIVCFHVHDAVDPTSNNCHIATIRFPYSNNSTQSPVCYEHMI